MYKKNRILKVLKRGEPKDVWRSKDTWICSDENPKDEDDKNLIFELFYAPNDIKIGDIVEGRYMLFHNSMLHSFSWGVREPKDFSTKPYKFIKFYKKDLFN